MLLKRVIIIFITCSALLFVNSCDENSGNQYENSIIPEKFRVDIPGSLSYELKSTKSTTNDTLSGDEIYQHLNFFIAIGERSAELVEEIIYTIRYHNIENVTQIMFTSDEDERVKHLVVRKNEVFSDREWEYGLTITDYESETYNDGGKALQVFWNNNPAEGIAILKPYNIDRNNGAINAMYQIEYSSVGNKTYEEFMVVQITGLPLPDASVEPYALENMKMYVGRSGNVVDVYGNSSHPNARFDYVNETESGFNWAFVASASEEKNIAVAELGLPASNNTSELRSVLLEENSVKNVLKRELTNAVVAEYNISDTSLVGPYIEPYLANTEAPAFFTSKGFSAAGKSPGEEYVDLISRIKGLSPFSPIMVSKLSIGFK